VEPSARVSFLVADRKPAAFSVENKQQAEQMLVKK
jgi:hypothetical protein